MPNVISQTSRQHFSGAWVMAVASGIGLILMLIAYFVPHGPIAWQWGTLLVVVSTALMLMASLLLELAAMPRWLVRTFQVLIILDVLGTGVCAYFLEAPALLILILIALAGWIAHLAWDSPHFSGS
jgi:hypothetical protein